MFTINSIRAATVAMALACAALPAAAHHSVSAQFDVDKTLDMEGTLVKVDWINPHGYLHFEVKDAAGKVTTWSVETVPPAGWRRLGVASKGFLPVGTVYKFQFCPARDGSNTGLLTIMYLPDGRKLSVLGEQQAG